MTAQALINPFGTAHFPGEHCAYVHAKGEVHDPGATVNRIAVCHKSLAGALCLPVYLVTPW